MSSQTPSRKNKSKTPGKQNTPASTIQTRRSSAIKRLMDDTVKVAPGHLDIQSVPGANIPAEQPDGSKVLVGLYSHYNIEKMNANLNPSLITDSEEYGEHSGATMIKFKPLIEEEENEPDQRSEDSITKKARIGFGGLNMDSDVEMETLINTELPFLDTSGEQEDDDDDNKDKDDETGDIPNTPSQEENIKAMAVDLMGTISDQPTNTFGSPFTFGQIPSTSGAIKKTVKTVPPADAVGSPGKRGRDDAEIAAGQEIKKTKVTTTETTMKVVPDDYHHTEEDNSKAVKVPFWIPEAIFTGDRKVLRDLEANVKKTIDKISTIIKQPMQGPTRSPNTPRKYYIAVAPLPVPVMEVDKKTTVKETVSTGAIAIASGSGVPPRPVPQPINLQGDYRIRVPARREGDNPYVFTSATAQIDRGLLDAPTITIQYWRKIKRVNMLHATYDYTQAIFV